MPNSQPAFISGVVVASLAAFLGFQAGTVQPRAGAASARVVEPARLAVFDVLAVSEKLFLGDRFSPARETRVKQKQDEILAMENSAKEMVEQIQKLPESAPERQGLINTFQAKRDELESAKQRANEELSAFSTDQFSECYKQCIEAANTVARSRGYSHVIASRVGELKFRSKELPAALQEVLARPVLLSGDTDDLTPAVMKELKLDETVAPEKKAEGAAEPKAEEKK